MTAVCWEDSEPGLARLLYLSLMLMVSPCSLLPPVFLNFALSALSQQAQPRQPQQAPHAPAPQHTARQMESRTNPITPATMKGRAEVRRVSRGPVLLWAVSRLQLQPSTEQQTKREPEVPLCWGVNIGKHLKHQTMLIPHQPDP